MQSKSPSYSKVLDSEAKRIINDLGEIRELLEHNPSLGSAVEQTVSKLLRKLIPNSCEITSGFAVNHEGEISPQQDILIIRKDQIGALNTYAGFGIYPIEHVLASIEIKTNLKISELQSAMDSLEKLVSLSPNIPGKGDISKEPGNLIKQEIPICSPFTGVFGLETDIAIGRILHEAQNHSSAKEIKKRLNAIHVLGHSITCWVRENETIYPMLVADPQAMNAKDIKFDWEGRSLKLATSEVNSNQSLKTFLGILLSFLDWYRPPPIDLQKYLLTDLKLKFDVTPKPPAMS